ncbi:neurogenic locus notch homolog protein 4-like [Sycon ciliatum]|uniref:neurogenic locus notch homolog protein 4-like n=1 Tax=Sycon ciliatum TaxID=27933 RepID=UPI0031F6ECA3
MNYFEDLGRKQKEDDDGYSDDSFEGNTFIERKRIDAGSPAICSDEEFYSDDNLVECDGEDVECKLLRPSTDMDSVFAGSSPVVVQPGVSCNVLTCNNTAVSNNTVGRKTTKGSRLLETFLSNSREILLVDEPHVDTTGRKGTVELTLSLLNNGVSHNLRLCALKFPTDFSNGNILNSGGVKNYIASSLTEAKCRQNCSIISDLDKCDLCTGYLYNYNCLERDECLHQIHNCDSNAACTNTARSYNCTCNSGFSGDGRSCVCNCLNHGQCTEDGTCNCQKGFHGDKCQHNIDECLPASPCHVDAICIDNEGGYMCLCKSGYHGNGTQCQAVCTNPWVKKNKACECKPRPDGPICTEGKG